MPHMWHLSDVDLQYLMDIMQINNSSILLMADEIADQELLLVKVLRHLYFKRL